MKLLPALCCALAVFSAILHAADSILPKGWDPSSADAVEFLQQELQNETAQQGINRLTGHIAGVLDAQLLVAYVRLYDRLDEKGKSALKAEQSEWLAKRRIVAKSAAKTDEGGSASPMDANTAFADFTTKRLHALEARVKNLGAR